jgi:GPH family glycoside/pentoside/hexuronide:cation symporter
MSDAIAIAAEGEENERTVSQSAAPLSFKVKASFATGDAVDGIVNFGAVTFSFYYLTAVCGLSSSVVGTLLLISLTIDGFADPLIGSLSDATRSRYGRRLPYMFASAVPVGLSFGLLFSVPLGLPDWALVTYVAVVLLFLRITMSVFTLPYGALGAELSTDYRERSTLVAYRWFYNCSGNLIVLVLGYWVFMRGQAGLLDHSAYIGFGWVCGAIAFAAALASAFGALPQMPRLKSVPVGGAPSALRLFKEIREAFANRSFVLLFLSVLLFWTGAGVSATLALHANLYFWKLPSDVIATLPLIGLVGFGVGIPITARLLQRYEKRDVAVGGLVIGGVAQLVLPPLRIAGLIPDAGMTLYTLLAVTVVIASMAGTCALVSWVSMMADAAEEHEYLFGSRREGLYFAGLTLSGKAAGGLGGLVGGLALEAIGFPQDPAAVAAIAAHPLAADTVRNLGLVQGPAAALISLAGAVILLGYRLDEKENRRIQAELARRQAQGAPS